MILVSLGAKKWGASRGTVILIGVAMNSLLGAVSDSIITFIPEVGVMSNNFKIGEFSAVTYQKLVPAMFIIAVAIVVLITLHNELDVLSLGEESAKGLGLNTGLMRMLFLLFVALLAGCAVSLAGLLSFVGLLVPHAVRRIAGSKSSNLLGLCALYGAGFVCLCDTLARTAFSPYEIPVGIIMAFLGAPFFVYILIKGRGVTGVIELKNICAGYEKNIVIKGLSTIFEKGKLISIIGVNGCGKSTLLKTIVGIIPSSSGEILIDGECLGNMTRTEVARKIAYLAQGKNTPDMTVEQLVLHGRFPYLNYPRRYSEKDRELAFSAMKKLALQSASENRFTLCRAVCVRMPILPWLLLKIQAIFFLMSQPPILIFLISLS